MASQPPPWEQYQPRPVAPQIVIPTQPTPRTPEQVTIQQGQAAAAPLDRPKAEADLRRTNQQVEQGDTSGHNFSDERAMRSSFEGLPDVRNYHTVLPVAVAARQAANGGAGDLDLVYAFARVMDPGSVVREGEVQMTQNTGGIGDRVQGMLQGLRNGQHLTPNVRQRLLTEIDNRVSQYRAAYNQIRKNYFRNAERYGFSTDAAVGPDIGEAYQATPNPADAPVPGFSGAVTLGQSGGAVGDISTGAVRPTGDVSQLAAASAPGAVTTTDAREGAGAVPVIAPGIEDTTGTSANPRYVTPQDALYNEHFGAQVMRGASREELNQWLAQNYPVIYPGQTAPTVDDATWQTIEESRRTGSGLDINPRATGINDEEYHSQAESRAGAAAREAWAEEHPFLAGVDTAVRTAANTVTLGAADRIAGRLNGTSAATEHGVTSADWRDRPIQSLVGTTAGSVALPYGRTAPRQIGAGAAYGGITDYNNADGSQGDRLQSAYRGIFTGGATNAAYAGASRAFRAPNAQAVIDAGERQNVRVPRFMIGNEGSQVATGAIGATPGRIPLARAAGEVVEDLGAARNRAAAEIGDVGDQFEAGRRAQSGARDFLRRSADRATQLFERIRIRPETPAELTNTRQALDEMTAGLTSNTRLSGLLEDRRLVAFRDALQSGELSWADQRRFRSLIGEMIGQPQVAGEVTSRASLRRLYGALSDDMQATAASQGPRALSDFNRANRYYRGREARREGVIQDILGADGQAAPEDTFRMINRWAQSGTSDTRSLGQALRSLPRDDANAVRASLFGRMGQAKPGGQDQTGEIFSPSTFATQWNQLDRRARALLVPSAAHRRNLDDIALLASSMRRSERFQNTSNTGLGVNLGAAVVGGVANAPATAGGALATYVAGRMLASPAGSRSLLRALRNPEAYRELIQAQEEDEQ